MICIYSIRHILSGKEYIGSSSNFNKRKRQHLLDLNKQTHHSIYLQRAWNKYGSDSFEFIILEYCNIDNLLILEQIYLDNRNPIYNMSPTAKNVLGIKRSNETKLKLSLSHKGQKAWNKGIARTQEQKDKQSMKMLGRASGAKGKKWSDESKKKLATSMIGRTLSNETKLKLSKGVVRHSDTETKEYDSIQEASIDNGIQKTNIVSACKGKRKTAGGFEWTYKNQ